MGLKKWGVFAVQFFRGLLLRGYAGGEPSQRVDRRVAGFLHNKEQADTPIKKQLYLELDVYRELIIPATAEEERAGEVRQSGELQRSAGAGKAGSAPACLLCGLKTTGSVAKMPDGSWRPQAMHQV